MSIINKNEGPKILFEAMGNRVFFNDGEIMVDVSKRQRDYPVLIDICMDRDRNLVIGAAAGLYYVAQLMVPEAQYIYPELVMPIQEDENSGGGMQMDGEQPEKKPFRMDDVTMMLWSLENLEVIQEENSNEL
ncbi:MAG: hypothetical protein RR212_10850 [Bacteroidales bacterium]